VSDFFCGVIEGFYGRQWSWQSRRHYAGFMAEQGFSTYIYAPKGQALLRGQWRQPVDDGTASQLKAVADEYHRHGLRFGVGLSPLGLQEEFSPASRRQLQDKLRQLNELGIDTLCLLFDDMPGAISDLARRQLILVDDMLAVSAASQHIICPSYYSFDPVLESLFGARPVNYWSELGQGLPADVGYFWTGQRVISSSYGQQDLQAITEQMGRKPVLWDNYPVNDGRATSPFLHLRAYTGRPHQLQDWSAGHCVNPMNQAELSRLVLFSLGELYRNRHAYQPWRAQLKAFKYCLGDELAQRLLEDVALFQDVGLQALSAQQLEQIQRRYAPYGEQPLIGELLAWLRGEYRFDPACLTG
jgi:hypothetical protein